MIRPIRISHLLGCLAAAGLTVAAGSVAGSPAAGGEALAHLRALGEIAAANGGNRAAGTSGYDRSAEYVADVLRRAGYAVRVEGFSFPYFEERSPPRLLIKQPGQAATAANATEMSTMSNSGSGKVTGSLHAVDLGLAAGAPSTSGPSTSGCERSDFDRLPPGGVALMRRGTCTFQQKVENAVAAGAMAVIVMNEGGEDRKGVFPARLRVPASVPVLAVAYELGRRLADRAEDAGATVTLSVDAVRGERSTHNVIAERPGMPAGPVIVAGAHLDSVPQGPGANDNASGVAALLEAAVRLAGGTAPHIRFALWGAEERGLIGSRHHVARLSEKDREGIALYLNLDMVGSLNYGRFVQGSEATPGSVAEAARASLVAFFERRGLPVENRTQEAGRRAGYGSDDASFAQAGIPTLGLYTGAGEKKSKEAAARFGGTRGAPYDPCYHQACDTSANVDPAVLDEMTDALVEMFEALSASRASGGPREPA